jgi:hypothetical protein
MNSIHSFKIYHPSCLYCLIYIALYIDKKTVNGILLNTKFAYTNDNLTCLLYYKQKCHMLYVSHHRIQSVVVSFLISLFHSKKKKTIQTKQDTIFHTSIGSHPSHSVNCYRENCRWCENRFSTLLRQRNKRKLEPPISRCKVLPR